MPRASSASLAVTAADAPIARLRPPPDLDQLEREEFLAIVLGVRPDHFMACDTPLLAAYTKAIVLERVASGELRSAGYVDGDRPSPWLNILTQATRSMTVLSRMLRLNPQARSPLVEEPQNVSFYERQRLLEGRSDDAN
jgi:phage terminase small subunit